ncbi:hypothetical protein UL72_20325 [Shigella dysenteriae]|nr:hypothetical protein CUA66_23825 [Shigella dysenteriae]RIE75787.1 hypothetical protein UL72_20325 [Shigella dysenteriae]
MDINNWQEQSINNIYRFISGLIGIYIAVFVFYIISKNTLLLNSLSLLGKHTLSIYIIQTFIFIGLVNSMLLMYIRMNIHIHW